ncbi:hypothetical protein [Micromonospora tulbaghiae]|uniref:hypothetical protein n=1 Tax=Micromonospora tulbaghiae TaxID=479978 RepID=UPI0036D04931
MQHRVRQAEDGRIPELAPLPPHPKLDRLLADAGPVQLHDAAVLARYRAMKRTATPVGRVDCGTA